LLVFRDRLPALIPLLLSAMIIALGWRFAVYHDCALPDGSSLCGIMKVQKRIAQGTDTIFDCILYGAVTALALHYYGERLRRLCINNAALALSVGGLVFSLLWRDPLFRGTIRYSLQGFCVSLVLVNIVYGSWRLPRQFLSQPAALWLGKMSYSLYIYHFGVLMTLLALNKSRYLTSFNEVALYLVFSLILSFASYYWIEKPAFIFRTRYRLHEA
jgi:peptidoglycan/LPS O-acetylase OafA/YrhL